MRLILVRHGESVGNSENRLQGPHGDLTDFGRRQAERLAERLFDFEVAALYTSPLARALETARTVGARLGQEPAVLPGVAEYHFGDLAGMTYAEVRAHFAASPQTAALSANERVYPGEEGREAFFQRVTESIWGVVDRHAGETAAVISHGGPIALFCQKVLGLPYRRPMPFAIGNCSLTLIEVAEGERHPEERPTLLARLNDTCHLRSLRRD